MYFRGTSRSQLGYDPMISLDPCGKISWEEYTLHRRQVYTRRARGGALLWHWQIIFKYPPTWFAWLSTEQALKLFLHILTGCKSGKIQSSPMGVLRFSLPLYCRGIHVFSLHAVFLSEVYEKHTHTHRHNCVSVNDNDSLTFLFSDEQQFFSASFCANARWVHLVKLIHS